MKRSVIIVVLSSMLLCSCGGTLTGAFMGGALGGAIGGITGGYRGHDVGVLVGMAAGAAVGASVDAAEANRQCQQSQVADDMYMHQQGRMSRQDRAYQQHRDAYAQYYYQKNAQHHSFKLEKSDSDKMVRPEDMIDTTNSGNDVISME